ncbi:hypothetical protein [Cereibacter sediminicola]|uniref:hypothetical protein n=1 Tax=Cereibacter sediminicola TaxID=2584941 RepID=UPI0011A97034|nr:hypothetical protein [Cereibacter sediminicola]
MSSDPPVYVMYPGYAPAPGGARVPRSACWPGPGWAAQPAPWPQPAAGWPPTAQPTAQAAATPANASMLNGRFVAGLLVGGAITYVLSNEAVQRSVMRGAMQLWMGLQGGLQETRERFRDAEAEVRAHKGE